MVDKAIPDYPPAALPLTGAELVECVQLGNSRQVTAQDIANLFSGLQSTGGTMTGDLVFSGANLQFDDGGTQTNGITGSNDGLLMTFADSLGPDHWLLSNGTGGIRLDALGSSVDIGITIATKGAGALTLDANSFDLNGAAGMTVDLGTTFALTAAGAATYSAASHGFTGPATVSTTLDVAQSITVSTGVANATDAEIKLVGSSLIQSDVQLNFATQGTTAFQFTFGTTGWGTDGGTIGARIEPAGTVMSNTDTVATREKGDARWLSLTGGTLTGGLTLSAGSINVDNGSVNITGGTFGVLDLDGPSGGLIRFNGSNRFFISTGSTILYDAAAAVAYTFVAAGTSMPSATTAANREKGDARWARGDGVSSAGPVGLPSYTVAGLPAVTTDPSMIYVSDETGGATPAFSDGTNWRRVSDLAIVS